MDEAERSIAKDGGLGHGRHCAQTWRTFVGSL